MKTTLLALPMTLLLFACGDDVTGSGGAGGDGGGAASTSSSTSTAASTATSSTSATSTSSATTSAATSSSDASTVGPTTATGVGGGGEGGFDVTTAGPVTASSASSASGAGGGCNIEPQEIPAGAPLGIAVTGDRLGGNAEDVWILFTRSRLDCDDPEIWIQECPEQMSYKLRYRLEPSEQVNGTYDTTELDGYAEEVFPEDCCELHAGELTTGFFEMSDYVAGEDFEVYVQGTGTQADGEPGWPITWCP